MSAGLALVSEGAALGNISLSARTPLIDGQIVEVIFVEPSKMNLTSTLPAKITGDIEFDLIEPKRFSLKGNLPVSVGAEVFTPASKIEILAIEDIIILVDILAVPGELRLSLSPPSISAHTVIIPAVPAKLSLSSIPAKIFKFHTFQIVPDIGILQLTGSKVNTETIFNSVPAKQTFSGIPDIAISGSVELIPQKALITLHGSPGINVISVPGPIGPDSDDPTTQSLKLNLPFFTFELFNGAFFSGDFSLLELDIAAIPGRRITFAGTLPVFSFNAFSAGQINITLPEIGYDASALSSITASLETTLPELNLSGKLSLSGLNNLEGTFPSLALTISTFTSPEVSIIGALPKLSISGNIIIGQSATVIIELPKLTGQFSGIKSFPTNINILFPSLQMMIKSGELKTMVLRYQKELIR